MRNKNRFAGITLVLIGCLLLLANSVLNIFDSGERIWPYTVICMGIILEAGYFYTRKASALLIPGAILCTNGLLFVFEVNTNWEHAAFTWPVYTLGVAIGLFQYYICGKKNSGVFFSMMMLLSITVLGLIIAAFEILSCWKYFGGVMPAVIFIGIGLATLLIKQKNINTTNENMK